MVVFGARGLGFRKERQIERLLVWGNLQYYACATNWLKRNERDKTQKESKAPVIVSSLNSFSFHS